MPKKEEKIEMNRVLGCIQENKDARCIMYCIPSLSRVTDNVFPLHFDVYHIV